MNKESIFMYRWIYWLLRKKRWCFLRKVWHKTCKTHKIGSMTRLNNYADNRLETSFYLSMARYYMLIIETIEDDDNGHAQIRYFRVDPNKMLLVLWQNHYRLKITSYMLFLIFVRIILPLRQSKALYKFGFFEGIFGDFQKKTQI